MAGEIVNGGVESGVGVAVCCVQSYRRDSSVQPRRSALAANVLWNAALERRAPAVARAHDVIHALEPEWFGVARGGRIVLLREHVRLDRVAAHREHRRESHDVSRQLSRAFGRASSHERRLASSFHGASPLQLTYHRIRQSCAGAESNGSRELTWID